MNDITLSVSEVFGPTIQGEGPSQGRAVAFVRLGLCNLDCRWCDTPFTWDWTGKNGTAYDKETELHRMSIDDILVALDDLHDVDHAPIDRVVISGGEPLVQQRRLVHLIAALAERDIAVEIETNGTIIPNPDLAELALDGWVAFNCSPKLANSGIDHDTRIVPEALDAISQLPSIFKFVITDEHDCTEIETLVASTLNHVHPKQVYVMPEGIEREVILDRLPWVMTQAAKRGWSVSPRLHVLAYGNQRGI